MTGVVSLAHIAGPLRQALAVIDNETWLFEANGDRRRPERNDIAFFSTMAWKFCASRQHQSKRSHSTEYCVGSLMNPFGMTRWQP